MKLVSVVFHPLLIATYLIALLLYKAPELLPRIQPQVQLQFLMVILLITGVMPAFSIIILKTFKYISDLELLKRRERITPFTFILFYYCIASYLFMEKLEMEFLFNMLITSSTLLIFILLLITVRFKISTHSAAIWSAVGYLTAIIITQGIDVDWIYYLLVTLAGLTATSRLYLDCHTSKEVWSGTILGFGYSLLVVLIFT
ncbi:MAG: phosphatase PAP2 family protein [Bacteroidota bacterium]